MKFFFLFTSFTGVLDCESRGFDDASHIETITLTTYYIVKLVAYIFEGHQLCQ